LIKAECCAILTSSGADRGALPSEVRSGGSAPEEASAMQSTTIGLDLVKNLLRRDQVAAFFFPQPGRHGSMLERPPLGMQAGVDGPHCAPHGPAIRQAVWCDVKVASVAVSLS